MTTMPELQGLAGPDSAPDGQPRSSLHQHGVTADYLAGVAAGEATKRSRKEIARLLTAEQDLTAEFLARAAKLETLVPTVGDALLDAHLAPEIDSQKAIGREGAGRHELTGSIARAKAELEALESSINAARRRRAAAIRDLYKAQAADLRREAANLIGGADKRQQKTDKLLAELQAYEGCTYRPYRPMDHVPGVAGQPQKVIVRLPQTEWMRQSAQHLETQAEALESRPVNNGGGRTAYTLDDLIALLYSDAEQIMPRELDVREWAEPLECAAWQRIRKTPFRAAWVTFHLACDNSEILKERSSVKLAAVHKDEREKVPETVPERAVRTPQDFV